jgi:signal peptidase I
VPDRRAEPAEEAGPDARPERSWSRGPDDSSEPVEPARKGSFLTELPVLILVAFVLAILMKTFLVQAFFIPSSSMEPTLLVDDRVLVNKLSYTLREPRRGEVVVFSERGLDPLDSDTGLVEGVIESLRTGLGFAAPSEKDFIKRIIGLPGETLELREGVIYIDGTPIDEAPTTEGGYLSARDMTDFGPVTVPDGEFFMMGDNRPASADSRSSLGTIPRDDIVGRAFVVIWPLDRLAALPIEGYEGVAVEAGAALHDPPGLPSVVAADPLCATAFGCSSATGGRGER